MKALILSCNTGGGHNSAARAIAEEMQERGDEAYVLDYLCLAGEGVSRLVGDGYVQIVKKTPRLFGLFYKLGMVASRLLKKSPVYYINGRMAKYLDGYLREHPVDVLIMPHLYPAETITYMKRKGMKLPLTVAVMTDYTCIPFWEETDLDYYVIPHEDLIPEYVKRGVPEEKLLPYGIPVRQDFCRNLSKEAARKKLHLPMDVPMFLVMSGSMGFGKLAVFAAELALRCRNGEHIVIICGNNAKIERILRKEFHFNKRVHIIGYTNHVSLFMDACDVIYTKPGGLTSTESLVKNIPIVHTAPIPGCETSNLHFFGARHLSVSSKHLAKQVQLGKALIENDSLREQMSEAQRRERKPEAAMQIVSLLEQLVSHE